VRLLPSLCYPAAFILTVAARALRLSVMFGIGQETAPSTFAHNDKSRIYLKGGAVDFFRIW
jgi:hypothetical protein